MNNHEFYCICQSNKGKQGFCNILPEYQKDLAIYMKALELLAKDYCESMGCAFCDHHAECLEANHFKNLEGKEFLKYLFINEARGAEE